VYSLHKTEQNAGIGKIYYTICRKCLLQQIFPVNGVWGVELLRQRFKSVSRKVLFRKLYTRFVIIIIIIIIIVMSPVTGLFFPAILLNQQ
jgi:hypothetical protein